MKLSQFGSVYSGGPGLPAVADAADGRLVPPGKVVDGENIIVPENETRVFTTGGMEILDDLLKWQKGLLTATD